MRVVRNLNNDEDFNCQGQKKTDQSKTKAEKGKKKAEQIKKKGEQVKQKVEPGEKRKNKNDDYYCIFCKDEYVSAPDEDWIMCFVCKKWAHEKCTDRQSSSAGYKCNLCRN